MIRCLSTLLFIAYCLLPVVGNAQRITYTEPLANDNRDINFEIIGKVKSNILVFKNIRFKYAISVYNDSMVLKDKKDLDIIEGKTFNVDFITYPDFFYLIYQYQRKRIVYCMAVKLDAEGNMIEKPVKLDSTSINVFGDNKIYSVINSEDKKFISIFKIQKKNERLNFSTLLFNNELKFINKADYILPFNEKKDIYNNFLLDNEGNFVFTRSTTSGNADYSSQMQLYVKSVAADTLMKHDIDLNEKYLDEIKLKIDNVNKRYLINSFYYKQKRGSIDGIFSFIWDKQGDSLFVNRFLYLDEEIRALAKKNASIRTAFDNFFIKNIIVKKDGGFILIAEDFYTISQGYNNNNIWNRWDYFYSPYSNPYGYYYDPFYRSFYNNNNAPNTKYIYNSLLAISFDSKAVAQWSRIIEKEQFDNDNDNYLSFVNFNTGGQIHFFFNLLERRKQLLSDYSITADGSVTRNATFRKLDEGYEFMPQFGKQVGARQIIIPCTFRNSLICFAKIDY
ncbi:hypothetical protein ACQ33O_00950 [Ferruginibacter sp. SUN002]|uniref:hypothetical protein n=1 Tax=Ferruginibacter sp. SUN002 TaxID=2937789 RepID=UPI003D35A453